MENKEQRVWTIITIATITVLVFIFAGITYAFFTTSDNTGSTAEITNTSGKMIITYADGGSNLLISSNISPSNNIIANKTFTLTGLNTTTAGDGLTMPYKVGLKYTSSFSDGQIHYYIKKLSSTSDTITTEFTGEANQTVPGNETYTGYSHGTLKNGNNKYTEMVTGEFPASNDAQTITFNLVMQFPDTGENQDTEKGKSINAEVVVNYEPSFADDTWSDIADNVKNGIFYKIGEEKEVEIDGTSYTVRVANNTTPDECNSEDFSQTACGFVVEFVDIVETRMMNSSGTNVGGWPATSMRTYANGDFFNKIPTDLQNVIIDTKVISGHGSTSEETNFTSTDKIYLLSGHEVYTDGTSDAISSRDTAYNNTRQLDYYSAKGVTTSSYTNAIKQNNDSNAYWWLRSAYSSYKYRFLSVDSYGTWNSNDADYSYYGFAPAFRIG